MKKDLEWLKNEVNEIKKLISDAWGAAIIAGNRHFETKNSSEMQIVKRISDLINQLDEPEVLSQEWIDKYSNGPSRSQYVWVDDLKELLVPKQEEVKVPQFIANYLPLVKEDIELERASYYAVTNNELPKWKKEYDWIRENFETFVKAWLAYPNIEVEEEQGWIIREKGTNFVLNSLDLKVKDAKGTLGISTGWSSVDLEGIVFESKETANSIANLLRQRVKVEELEE